MTTQPPTQYHHHGRFHVAGGTLPDAVTAYRTYGDPNNPWIVFPTCFGAKLDSQVYMVGEGKVMDPTKYFVVTFALFSNGESSSPSNTAPPYNGPYFPAVSYEDNIRAQHAVLQKLGVKKVYAVIGFSMGGQQAYHWPVMYPELVERYVVICGSARTSPHNICFLEGPKAALVASKDFYDGHYTEKAEEGIRAFARVYSAWAYGQTWFREHKYTFGGLYPDLATFLRERWEDRFLSNWDANDLIVLLHTWQRGDVSKIRDGGDLHACLSKIRAKGLIMPSKTDLYFPPEDSVSEMRSLTIQARLVVIDTVWGHTALFVEKAFCVGTPFGLATGTTGGGSATAAVPSSLAELTTWLSDSTARVILLDKTFDFTSAEGTVTAEGCAPWTCTPNPQLAINANGWCDNYEPSAAKVSITYNAAGTNPLKVGSNKTLLGKGSAGAIVGKGLKITGSTNVIIQNIKIVTINPEYVWGGDAIQIDGASKVWIDHNTIQHVGRQMIVTGYGAVTATTISNNVFNGDSTYSATCNGDHYWAALFTGNGDQITFALNYLYKTSGRGPHVGTSGYYQNVHAYNNYFVSIGGHAVDPEVGSKVLLEGNYFNVVTTPVLSGGTGQAYAPVTAAQAAACASLLGRNCVVNVALSSGALPGVATDTGTLNGFTASVYKSASIMAATSVGSYVQSNAGVGIVN